MKEVLVINGHPDKESYNHSLSESYLSGTRKTNGSCTQLNISDLDFNPNLAFGYRKKMVLEPSLLEAIEKIRKADHLVWVFPMWWYGYPALMKGFVDRIFLPGIAFQPIKGKALPKKLLKGKTARLIITADTPKWYDKWIMGSPTIHQFKKGTLQFCGVSPVKVTYIAPIKNSSNAFRAKWLQKVAVLGETLS